MDKYGFKVEMPYCAQVAKHCDKPPYCKQCEKELPHDLNNEETNKKNEKNNTKNKKSENNKSKQLTTVQANNTRNVTKVSFFCHILSFNT
jgi:hypothetical protein